MPSRKIGIFVITVVIFSCYVGSKVYLGQSENTRKRSMRIAETKHDVASDKNQALVTLFTTFDNNPDKMIVFYNTIRNWKEMLPEVNIILFLPPTPEDVPSKLLSSAKSNGWTVLSVPRISRTGKLFIKDLYLRAMLEFNTTFYSFVSGDILFDDGFMKTLRLVDKELQLLGATMVIGRRTNAFVEKTRVVSTFADVSQLAEERGHLYRVDALDFFVTSRGYPWDQFRDVTVGRPGFDNYVAGLAVMSKMMVIDGTHTILALHQTVVPENAGPAPKIPVYAGERKNVFGGIWGRKGGGGVNEQFS